MKTVLVFLLVSTSVFSTQLKDLPAEIQHYLSLGRQVTLVPSVAPSETSFVYSPFGKPSMNVQNVVPFSPVMDQTSNDIQSTDYLQTYQQTQTKYSNDVQNAVYYAQPIVQYTEHLQYNTVPVYPNTRQPRMTNEQYVDMLWFKTENGSTYSLDYYKLANIYRTGVYGISRNITQAIELFEKAAEFGSHSALYQLGLIYLQGDAEAGVLVDQKKGYEYLLDGVSDGNERSYVYLKGILRASDKTSHYVHLLDELLFGDFSQRPVLLYIFMNYDYLTA